jgi:wyosine [tRNA(Phe)-imidazoG37] synthetase (radical SAM superfamily)
MPKCLIVKNGITFGTTGAVRPCCAFDTVGEPSVKFDEDWQTWFDGFDKKLKQGWISNCKECEQSEKLGKRSLRQYYNNILEDNNSIQYWDLKINSTCNYACRMCDLSSSSTWDKILKSNIDQKWDKHYTKRDLGKWHKDSAGLVDLMWNAKVVKFTGGEPFLIPQVKKIIQTLVDKGWSKNINLAFISNGSQDITAWNHLFEHFKSVHVSFSVDAIGERFEYIRPGASWETVKQNVELFQALKPDNTFITITCLRMLLNKGYTHLVRKWSNSIGANDFDLAGPIIYPDFLQEDVMDNPKLKDKFIKQMEIQDKIHGTNWRDFVNE